jgi:hypothetical protein
VIQIESKHRTDQDKDGEKNAFGVYQNYVCQFHYTVVVFLEQVEVNHQSDMDCPEKKKANLGCEKREIERRTMSRVIGVRKTGTKSFVKYAV